MDGGASSAWGGGLNTAGVSYLFDADQFTSAVVTVHVRVKESDEDYVIRLHETREQAAAVVADAISEATLICSSPTARLRSSGGHTQHDRRAPIDRV
jgi:hypothetical protein